MKSPLNKLLDELNHILEKEPDNKGIQFAINRAKRLLPIEAKRESDIWDAAELYWNDLGNESTSKDEYFKSINL